MRMLACVSYYDAGEKHTLRKVKRKKSSWCVWSCGNPEDHKSTFSLSFPLLLLHSPTTGILRLEFQTSPHFLSLAQPLSRLLSYSCSAPVESSGGGWTSVNLLKHVKVTKHFVTLFKCFINACLTTYVNKRAAFVCFSLGYTMFLMQAKLTNPVNKVTLTWFFFCTVV